MAQGATPARDVEAMRRDAEAPVQGGPEDAEEVAASLAAAFARDPHMDWFMRTDAGREAARHAFFRLLIADNLSFARIDRPKSGGAAAVWMPFEWLRPTPLSAELRMLPTMLRTTGLSRFGRLMAIRADMDKHHPMERRHAYLWFLGVAPEAQGMGIGSALLRAANARLDAEGLPAYLETGTTRNVALYRRHGFEVISEHKARADAPTMWSMWREPAT
jgi:ribosomal protein S18 acetylase RimI-like enzyme